MTSKDFENYENQNKWSPFENRDAVIKAFVEVLNELPCESSGYEFIKSLHDQFKKRDWLSERQLTALDTFLIHIYDRDEDGYCYDNDWIYK